MAGRLGVRRQTLSRRAGEGRWRGQSRSRQARWRDTHAVIAVELLPARVGRGSSVGEDAVLLLMDAHGAAKGLPHNELASRVCRACGRKALTCRGDAFLCRLREDDGALRLGGAATPEMMGAEDWLAKAQKCASLAQGAGVTSPLQQALTTQLAAAAAKVAATADAAAATAAELHRLRQVPELPPASVRRRRHGGRVLLPAPVPRPRALPRLGGVLPEPAAGRHRLRGARALRHQPHQPPRLPAAHHPDPQPPPSPAHPPPPRGRPATARCGALQRACRLAPHQLQRDRAGGPGQGLEGMRRLRRLGHHTR